MGQRSTEPVAPSTLMEPETPAELRLLAVKTVYDVARQELKYDEAVLKLRHLMIKELKLAGVKVPASVEDAEMPLHDPSLAAPRITTKRRIPRDVSSSEHSDEDEVGKRKRPNRIHLDDDSSDANSD